MESVEEPLFLANRQEGLGIVRAAEIRRTKNTGQRYIRAEVSFGDTEDATCVMNRIVYTRMVIHNGLSPLASAEEANVAWMVGKPVRVKWEHKKMLDGEIYVSAVALNIGV